MDTGLPLECLEVGRDHGWGLPPRPPDWRSSTFPRARRPHPLSLHFVWCSNASEHSGGANLQKVPFHEIYPRSVQCWFGGKHRGFFVFMYLYCILDHLSWWDCTLEQWLLQSWVMFYLKKWDFLLKISGFRGRILLFSWFSTGMSLLCSRCLGIS